MLETPLWGFREVIRALAEVGVHSNHCRRQSRRAEALARDASIWPVTAKGMAADRPARAAYPQSEVVSIGRLRPLKKRGEKQLFLTLPSSSPWERWETWFYSDSVCEGESSGVPFPMRI